MNEDKSTQDGAGHLPGFVPISELWQSGESRAIFPSEQSARWFLRSARDELATARAVALHAGRLMVHRARLLYVLEERSINLARRRVPSIHAGN